MTLNGREYYQKLKMAYKCLMFQLGVIILCSFPTGTSGAEEIHLFCSSGENVSLSCNNVLSGCSSTTWNHDRLETWKRKRKYNIERDERLSLGSDCSLNIRKVIQKDYGIYTCGLQGTAGHVYLHVLHVSSSSSQTEIRSGSVTLSCQLYLYGVSCDTLVRTEGLQMIWVNPAGVSVMTDSRYQILFSSTQCISTLTTTLLNEDHNREFRCQVTQRNQPKTSATYTVKYSAEAGTTTPVIPVHITNSEEPSTTNTLNFPKPVSPLVMVVICPGLALLFLASMLWVIYTKKADNKEEAVHSDVLTYVSYSWIPAENLSKRAMRVDTATSIPHIAPNQRK